MLGTIVDGIGPRGQVDSAGSGVDELLDRYRVVEPQKPKPPRERIPVRIGGDVQESELILKAAPVYPPLAIQARVSGDVILEAEIDEDGNVATIKIVGGHPLLIKAAVDAVKQWKYSPTLLNGEPQTVLALVQVVFRLK